MLRLRLSCNVLGMSSSKGWQPHTYLLLSIEQSFHVLNWTFFKRWEIELTYKRITFRTDHRWWRLDRGPSCLTWCSSNFKEGLFLTLEPSWHRHHHRTTWLHLTICDVVVVRLSSCSPVAVVEAFSSAADENVVVSFRERFAIETIGSDFLCLKQSSESLLS